MSDSGFQRNFVPESTLQLEQCCLRSLPGAELVKLFTAVIYKCASLARVFLNGKARNLPQRQAPERYFTRVGWKGLPQGQTL
jgi:hypothetical protein